MLSKDEKMSVHEIADELGMTGYSTSERTWLETFGWKDGSRSR
ncbi:MAG: hypothetical protein R6W73_07260 [Candidatus Saliniplasma sp.]